VAEEADNDLGISVTQQSQRCAAKIGRKHSLLCNSFLPSTPISSMFSLSYKVFNQNSTCVRLLSRTS